MYNKLKCVIVNDDETTLHILQNLCKDSSCVEITNAFSSPKKFLESFPLLDFDFCLLSVDMSELDGIIVAQLIASKPVIFITDTYDRIKEVIDLAPIDIISNPVDKNRLNIALKKAHLSLAKNNSKEYELFYTAESKGKIKLRLKDILFVGTDETDARNKKVIMSDGKQYTLMQCTLEKLLLLSNRLLRINKSELISLAALDKIESDLITLKATQKNAILTKQVTLSRTYKSSFLKHFSTH